MNDRFEDVSTGILAPATRAVAVLPSDSAALPFLPRAIYVGTGGALALRGEDGGESVWRNVAAGTLLPFRAAMVLHTGTTATDLLALD